MAALVAFSGAVFLLWVGYVAFWKPEKFWEWQERRNRQQGIIDSQPTEEWEKQRETAGIIALLSGIAFLIFAVHLFVQDVTLWSRLNEVGERYAQTQIPRLSTQAAAREQNDVNAHSPPVSGDIRESASATPPRE